MKELVRIHELQSREDLITLIDSYKKGIPWNYGVVLTAIRGVLNTAGRISRGRWLIPRLDSLDESRFDEYAKIITDEDMWKNLSPLEQVDLRDRFSALASRKNFYPPKIKK